MANLTVPIKVELPDDWVEQIVERLKNDPDSEWVEVIRCRDCTHAVHGKSIIWCPVLGARMKADDFCSYAERKEDG